MNVYRVILESLNRSMRSHNCKSVHVVAESICQASSAAERAFPRLGLTPTATACIWPLWPQPAVPPVGAIFASPTEEKTVSDVIFECATRIKS